MRLLSARLALGIGAAMILHQDGLASSEAFAGATQPSAEAILAEAAKLRCGGDLPNSGLVVPRVTRLLPGYGPGGFRIKTDNAQAQAFFDNGMQLAHAFSHDSAIAAFRESVRLDVGCGMCLWGEAYASGPTINYPISKADESRLAGLAERAVSLSAGASAKERALTAAMALRFKDGGGGGPGDLAFAQAMDRIAELHPADDALQVIAADAYMIHAVNSGNEANFPRAIALIERVLARNPDYAPAIHYYIHATEMTGVAGRAEPFANRLGRVAPSASHLVHMPSHTFYRVGRYHDAARANREAVLLGMADARRIELPLPMGVWRVPYHGHNVHFGIGGALISGDADTALFLARPVIATARRGEQVGTMLLAAALFAEGRMGPPTKILAETAPPGSSPYAQAYWRYARGEAAARLGNVAAVRAEANAIALPAQPTSGEAMLYRMAVIGRLTLKGRAAMMERRPQLALAYFREAARLQEMPDFARYADPPAFWYPVRADAAAALLALGRPREALAEADQVLAAWPREPMTLATRAAANAALGNRADAGRDRRAAQSGWHGEAGMLRR